MSNTGAASKPHSRNTGFIKEKRLAKLLYLPTFGTENNHVAEYDEVRSDPDFVEIYKDAGIYDTTRLETANKIFMKNILIRLIFLVVVALATVEVRAEMFSAGALRLRDQKIGSLKNHLLDAQGSIRRQG
ncbi:MAG: hypothetical protein Ct9H300mP7_1920 [Verrucomicrobiota bacterium]|nr:MAG: hypothetical protein Ct9H300mP7_1920 [Verrucomicrobiota bacterium]